ncbi:SagB family peptide dehydrogenase [Streptomyces sp. NPDC052000]|uniref:SagB family peptide dehydrogenase n=1 Tax=Streptomyces sp. NPDC052000 TaxID=3155676 RepID=UPI00344ED1B8
MTAHAPPAGATALGFLGSGHQPPDALPAADPARLPPVHKRYPSAPWVPLPSGDEPSVDAPLPRLSWLLRQTAGLTRMRWMSGLMPLGLSGSGTPRDRRVLLSPGRTGAASGSRYPVEVYVAHGASDGVPAGLAHYDPVHHVLERLRDGDGRGRLLGLLSTPPEREPELVLLLTSVLWRNAAKYGVFGYRLQSLDVGVVAAQAVAAAEATGLMATIHLHYDDTALDEVLSLSPFAESVFAVVTLHRAEDRPAPRAERNAPWYGPVPEAVPGPASISAVPEMAEAAALHSAIRAAAPGSRGWLPAWSPEAGALPHALPTADLKLADGFAGRRTVYGYRPAPVPEHTLAALLAAAAAPLPTDTPDRADALALRLAGVVQRVHAVATGAHVYDPVGHALIPTRPAEAVRAMIGAAKSPMLADECRTATATLAPCGDLRAGIERFGDRWYRTQNIAAGALAQRVALAAAAVGLESHVHCDFDPDRAASALGLGPGPGSLQPLVVVTVGPSSPQHSDPQLPLRDRA